MKILLIQGFINQVLVVYGEEDDNKDVATLGEITIKAPTSKKVIEEVQKVVKEEDITEIILSGRTGLLKELENYYKNIEGVTITWQ